MQHRLWVEDPKSLPHQWLGQRWLRTPQLITTGEVTAPFCYRYVRSVTQQQAT